jgi:biopolymer transport protein ExbD
MAMDLGTGTGKKGRAAPSMNVTPLVDVVLVLLIIFMVITPLLEKQFWLNLPNKPDKQEPPTPAEDNKTVMVIVTKKGEIKINTTVVPKDQFSAKLHRVLAAAGHRIVFFDADDDAPFGTAVDAMDLARGGGATTIAVVTDAMKH